MTALTVVAPADAQLGYIASLCREHGIPGPEAVHSKAEASEIIAAMRACESGRRFPRCVADEAKYTGPDPREQDEAARHAAGWTRASEGDDA